MNTFSKYCHNTLNSFLILNFEEATIKLKYSFHKLAFLYDVNNPNISEFLFEEFYLNFFASYTTVFRIFDHFIYIYFILFLFLKK